MPMRFHYLISTTFIALGIAGLASLVSYPFSVVGWARFYVPTRFRCLIFMTFVALGIAGFASLVSYFFSATKESCRVGTFLCAHAVSLLNIYDFCCIEHCGSRLVDELLFFSN